MKNTQIVLVSIISATLIYVGATVGMQVINNQPISINPVGSSSSVATIKIDTPTSTTVSLDSTTSTIVIDLAIGEGLAYNRVCNTTSTATSFVYLNVGGDAVVGSGYFLGAGDCFSDFILGGDLEGISNVPANVSVFYDSDN